MCSYHERLGPVIRFCWLRGGLRAGHVQISGRLLEGCVPSAQHGSVHLLIPLHSFHAHAKDNNIHLSKLHTLEALLITGEAYMMYQCVSEKCLFDAFTFKWVVLLS